MRIQMNIKIPSKRKQFNNPQPMNQEAESIRSWKCQETRKNLRNK